jgi:hypothetical protein
MLNVKEEILSSFHCNRIYFNVGLPTYTENLGLGQSLLTKK